jgi:hypothetical protein
MGTKLHFHTLHHNQKAQFACFCPILGRLLARRDTKFAHLSNCEWGGREVDLLSRNLFLQSFRNQFVWIFKWIEAVPLPEALYTKKMQTKQQECNRPRCSGCAPSPGATSQGPGPVRPLGGPLQHMKIQCKNSNCCPNPKIFRCVAHQSMGNG